MWPFRIRSFLKAIAKEIMEGNFIYEESRMFHERVTIKLNKASSIHIDYEKSYRRDDKVTDKESLCLSVEDISYRSSPRARIDVKLSWCERWYLFRLIRKLELIRRKLEQKLKTEKEAVERKAIEEQLNKLVENK